MVLWRKVLGQTMVGTHILVKTPFEEFFQINFGWPMDRTSLQVANTSFKDYCDNVFQ